MLEIRFSDSVEVELPLERAAKLCHEITEAMGWHILEQNSTRLVCQEPDRGFLRFTNLVGVELVLSHGAPGQVTVDINGRVFGWGPIQKRHLEEQIRNLRNLIDVASKKATLDKDKQFQPISLDAGKQASSGSLFAHPEIITREFDVFLCHNNTDKNEVKDIAGQLKVHGILPWLDEWELRPGLPWQRLLEDQIERIGSAAVFVGSEGIGPWQRQELEAFLREFINRGCPVIPVLLPSARQIPNLPIFLRGLTWVDFRKQVLDRIKHLVWGITGKRNKE